MTRRQIRTILPCLVTITILVCAPAINGADGDILLSIMATPTSFKNFPGHAFLLISIETKNGAKEEAMGFYPFPSNPAQAFVGGPGLVQQEFQKAPARFSNVSITVQRSINWAQRKKIYELADKYNSTHYQFTDSNCIDFIDAVAQAIQLHTPTRSPTQTPEAYVRALKKLN